MKPLATTARHHALKADLDELLHKHEHLTPPELLAIGAQIVGMLMAYQDRTSFTVHQCMELILANIELGNKAVIENAIMNMPTAGTA